MKTNLVRALGPLLCCGLLLFATTANAFTQQNIQVTPLVDLVVRDTSGKVVVRSRTDARGSVKIDDLAPGSYVAEIDGASLVKAVDKLVPPTPAKHDSDPSVGLSVGGLFGGGGSHHSDRQGAGPTQDSHGGSHSGGGVGLSIPASGSGGQHDEIGFDPVWQDLDLIVSISDGNGGAMFSSETTYCRDAMSHGMRIGFTVPPSGGSVFAQITWDAPVGGWQRR